MQRSRSVNLVVLDPGGAVLGRTGSFTVAQPWWQETAPIHDAVAERGEVRLDAVLRLLRAEPDPGGPMGGRVTYAAVGEPRAGAALDPVNDDDLSLLEPDPRRLPWAEPAGPAADLAWVASQVEVTGPARQHRSWNLSAIWSIPTADGLVWLKTVPPFLGHEPVALRALTTERAVTPVLLAAEGHRLLLADLPGDDGHGAAESEQVPMIETLVGIQATTVDRVDALVADGVPDLRSGPLAAELAALVDRRAPGRAALGRLVDGLGKRLDEAARWSPPDSLVHGDPHPGNARRHTEPPVWFDWGDSFVGNPLLDLAATHRMGPAAVRAWLAALVDRWPGCDPGRAADLLAPVAQLRQAWVYQRFLDGIEPTEHIYHHDDVDEAIEATEALIEPGSG